MGWGAVMNDSSTGGRWSPSEAENHINCLELLAALFALKCFQSSLSGKHVKIMIDNTTAVSVINNMGTCHSDNCNSIGIKIWEFCMSHNIIWLTTAHIPGSSNYRADKESRDFRSEDTEWIIDPTLLGIALDALNFSNHRLTCLHPGLTDNFLYTAPSNQTQMHLTLMHLLCHGLINTFIVFLPLVVSYKCFKKSSRTKKQG